MKKYRQYWINKLSLTDYEKIIFDEADVSRFREDFNCDNEYYHVIEHSALEDLQAKYDQAIKDRDTYKECYRSQQRLLDQEKKVNEIYQTALTVYSALKVNNLIEPGHPGNIALDALTKAKKIREGSGDA